MNEEHHTLRLPGEHQSLDGDTRDRGALDQQSCWHFRLCPHSIQHCALCTDVGIGKERRNVSNEDRAHLIASGDVLHGEEPPLLQWHDFGPWAHLFYGFLLYCRSLDDPSETPERGSIRGRCNTAQISKCQRPSSARIRALWVPAASTPL
ncbi:MAG TPA: hypothetical protein VM869_31465 [Enhygromyxa sp.]|nr:hypothetical protein [Enhygromyxa sp.]